MKKKKILGGAPLFMVAVYVIGDIYDRYPHAKDVKDLPKGKPVIVLSFKGAPPDELKYMSVSLTYTASKPDDWGVSKHKSCNGIILHLHPCSVYVDTRTTYPTGYVDRERGEVSFPLDLALSGPGDYRLESFAVLDDKYRYVGKKYSVGMDDSNFSRDDREFSLVPVGGATVPAIAYARHTDGAKNVLVSTRPGTFDVVGNAVVIPYSADTGRLHGALAALGQKKYEEPGNKPVGFFDRNGHFVMSAMTAMHLEMRAECPPVDESEPLRRALAKKPLFKKITYAALEKNPAEDSDTCDEIRVDDRGSGGHRYLIRSRGNKIFASRSAFGVRNYIDAMWLDKKLVYAFSLKQDRTKDDDAPVSVRFLDDEFLKIYPDEIKDFPAGELEQLELAVDQFMAVKVSEAGRHKAGAAP